MTEIKFHFNVADSIDYACRLLRKATRQGAAVVVTGPLPVLLNLDRALWAFDPVEFLPHRLLQPGQDVPARLRGTRLWLSEDPAARDRKSVV